MRSPVLAIVWEVGLGHRRGFLGVLTALPVCALGAHWLAAPERNEWLSALATVPLGFCLLALFVFFTFTEESREQKLAVFPVRLFSLPVRTVGLVAVPMISGALAVALFSVAWTTLVLSPLGGSPALLRPAAILVTGLNLYLAAMWGLAHFRLGRLFVCGVIGVLLVWGLVFPEALMPEAWAGLSHGGQHTVLLTGALALNSAAFVWAWTAVELQRHARPRATTGGIACRQTLGSATRTPLRPFSSPAQAQLWMEWRRNGRILPGVLLLLLVVGLPVLPLVIEFNPANTLQVAGWMILAPLALATVLGKAFAVVDFWSQDLSLPPFVAVRPQGSADLVFCKLRVAALSTALAWGLLMVGLGIMLAFWGDAALGKDIWRQFRSDHSRAGQFLIALLALMALLCITWRQLTVSLWLGLFGRVGVFSAAVVIGFALYFVGLPWLANWALGQDFLRWETRVPWDWFIWAITAMFVGKMGLASWSWNKSYHRGLVSAQRILGYWGFWVASTACLVALIVLALPGYPWIRNGLALFGLLWMPLARTGLATLSLSANRHRTPKAGRLALPPVASSTEPQMAISPGRSKIMTLALPSVAGALCVVAIVMAFRVVDHVPHGVSGGECQLRLLQLGEGSPTVVLESDLRGVIESWWPLLRELADNHRVVAYDRAGRAGSSPSSSPLTGERVAQQLHAALADARIAPPYLFVGNGAGASHARIFAHRYPDEIAGLVLIDPPPNETSAEALAWLDANRAEQMPEIRRWMQMYPAGVYGYGLLQFELAEQRLELLPLPARAAARGVRWDEVTDGTLYGMGINVGCMEPGPADEFRRMDEIVLEDRRAWPLPAVPVTLITGLKRGLLGNVDRPCLDDFLANRKLAQHRDWLQKLPSARHIVTLESGGDMPPDQPELIIRAVREMCSPSSSPRPAPSPGVP